MGVQSQSIKPTSPGPAAPVSEQPKFPIALSGGASQIGEMGSGKHIVRIIEHTDISQKYKYLADCPCGVQGRDYTEQGVRDYAAYHLKNRGIQS